MSEYANVTDASELDIGPALEVEDEFYERGCFTNGINGGKASLPSYMTCLEYLKLEETWKELKDTRPKIVWDKACQHFEDTAYLSPSISMFASWLRRKIDTLA